LTNANYVAVSINGTLVINKAIAIINLPDQTYTYDTLPKPASFTATPSDLSGVSLTYYDGTAWWPAAPVNVGTYPVAAALNNQNYEPAAAAATLSITPASQTITFSTLVNKPVGGSFTITTPQSIQSMQNIQSMQSMQSMVVTPAGKPGSGGGGGGGTPPSATASSGLPVTITSLTPAQCQATAGASSYTITLLAVGTCTLQATQAGNVNYNPATPVDGSFVIFSPTSAVTSSKTAALNSTAASTCNLAAGLTCVGNASLTITMSYPRTSPTLPTGKTTFTVGNLNFTTSSFAWLLTSGTWGQYQGVGTVNGVSGSVNFVVTVTAGGAGVGRFRIQIWNTGGIIYDNQPGTSNSAPLAAGDTLLTGGTISVKN